MEQKQRFIHLAQSGRFTVSELSEEFGITRKTEHKWLLRYAGGGIKALEERSRAPKKVSNRTSEEAERLIVRGGWHKLLTFKSLKNAFPH